MVEQGAVVQGHEAQGVGAAIRDQSVEAPTTGQTPFGCQSERQFLFSAQTKYRR